jgi:hypothetical protein
MKSPASSPVPAPNPYRLLACIATPAPPPVTAPLAGERGRDGEVPAAVMVVWVGPSWKKCERVLLGTASRVVAPDSPDPPVPNPAAAIAAACCVAVAGRELVGALGTDNDRARAACVPLPAAIVLVTAAAMPTAPARGGLRELAVIGRPALLMRCAMLATRAEGGRLPAGPPGMSEGLAVGLAGGDRPVGTQASISHHSNAASDSSLVKATHVTYLLPSPSVCLLSSTHTWCRASGHTCTRG